MKKELSLEELQIKAKALRIQERETHRKRYRMARDAGFSVHEAMVLMSKSEETICRLAQEKQALK